MRFRVGDTVRISKQSKLYGKRLVYPKDRNGRITHIYSNRTYPIRVEWDGRGWSWHREKDLKLYRRGE